MLEGQFITPSILGRRFTLNPLTVFLSLVFWTWMWGPVGAFLAVPLLIVGTGRGRSSVSRGRAGIAGMTALR